MLGHYSLLLQRLDGYTLGLNCVSIAIGRTCCIRLQVVLLCSRNFFIRGDVLSFNFCHGYRQCGFPGAGAVSLGVVCPPRVAPPRVGWRSAVGSVSPFLGLGSQKVIKTRQSQ